MSTQYVKRPSHAWPVDPQRYPLSGPSSGPVYVPPEYKPTGRPWATFILWATVGAVIASVGGGCLILGFVVWWSIMRDR
jgi:hypothetical protein